MKLESKKLQISKQKFNINLLFYFFLKYLVKIKLSDKQIMKILTIYAESGTGHTLDDFRNKVLASIHKQTKTALKQKQHLADILDEITDEAILKTFIFSVKLYSIKDLLLHEAKIKNLSDISKLESLHPLSLEYDKITVFNPYATRVNGALLSLIFFEKLEKGETNFISKEAEDFIKNLSNNAIELKKQGIEPNQIFMLMFSESVNQSITSDSGSDYEGRILSVLKNIGIQAEDVSKKHDKNDASTEFDFFFEIEGKKYGIGAKRTLRERYKQFIKTAQMTEIDVMVEITLGTDLTEEKVNSIRNHDVYLFVADEIYQTYQYLQIKEGVYSCKDFTMTTLMKL